MNDFNVISHLIDGPTLTNWYNILEQVDLQDGNHSILCEDRNSHNIAVIKPSKYNSNQYRKISLSEIVEYTRNLLNPPITGNLNSLRLATIVMSDDVFQGDMRAKTVDSLNEIENEPNVFATVKKQLAAMSQHALDKRIIEKPKSIWGCIQYYIYSWLFDQSSTIENLTYVRLKCNYQVEAANLIRDRILINIIYFEGSEKTPEGYSKEYEENPSVLEIFFASPADVTKKWLAKYHPDKYNANQPESAETFQKRIIILNNLWKAVIERQPGETEFDRIDAETLLIDL